MPHRRIDGGEVRVDGVVSMPVAEVQVAHHSIGTAGVLQYVELPDIRPLVLARAQEPESWPSSGAGGHPDLRLEPVPRLPQHLAVQLGRGERLALEGLTLRAYPHGCAGHGNVVAVLPVRLQLVIDGRLALLDVPLRLVEDLGVKVVKPNQLARVPARWDVLGPIHVLGGAHRRRPAGPLSRRILHVQIEALVIPASHLGQHAIAAVPAAAGRPLVRRAIAVCVGGALRHAFLLGAPSCVVVGGNVRAAERFECVQIFVHSVPSLQRLPDGNPSGGWGGGGGFGGRGGRGRGLATSGNPRPRRGDAGTWSGGIVFRGAGAGQGPRVRRLAPGQGLAARRRLHENRVSLVVRARHFRDHALAPLPAFQLGLFESDAATCLI
mmetsp:Transcript_13312/g.37653  ORF Transcript_13312/g.37653 Transcript_13312/m.37653 type:complete len:380 (-) Transcript_13312:449-1588(-)